jgi:hypothetical protein
VHHYHHWTLEIIRNIIELCQWKNLNRFSSTFPWLNNGTLRLFHALRTGKSPFF